MQVRAEIIAAGHTPPSDDVAGRRDLELATEALAQHRLRPYENLTRLAVAVRRDNLRRRNGIRAEQLARTLQQGPHLVELLLQQRVTHIRYVIRPHLRAQFTRRYAESRR